MEAERAGFEECLRRKRISSFNLERSAGQPGARFERHFFYIERTGQEES